jgi:hypothetical protein
MLNLSQYGVPEDLPKILEQFFTKDMKDLASEISIFLNTNGYDDVIEKYKNNPLFNNALGYLAVDQKANVLIPIIYHVKKEDLPLIHFEWKVPNQSLTFSNMYFLVFFNELYKKDTHINKIILSNRGAILRALADLSYTPWNDFLLPISEQMNKDFLGLPLFDSGKIA